MTVAAEPLSQRVRLVLLDAAGACVEASDGERLRHLANRLDEPLRLALAGLVKAGKSTLLNALLAERIAATDAAECTKIVTSYEYGDAPEARAVLPDGSTRPVRLITSEGVISLDSQGIQADDVRTIAVRLPRSPLRRLTIIDTPGIGSLSTQFSRRTEEFLRLETADEPADAVVFLMRQAHETDVRFLDAFRDLNLATAAPVNAIGALSRADEVAPGRSDSLDVAALVAHGYRREQRLRTLVQTVLPISGLLAETGATLQDDEFVALARLAQLPGDDVAALMSTVDAFAADDAACPVPAEQRQDLLRRLGMFGLRLSTALIASKQVTSRGGLADELVGRSGVTELRRVLTSQFTERAGLLKAQTALRAVEASLDRMPASAADRLRQEVERITSSAHGFAELRLLNALRIGDVPIDDDRRESMETLLGAEGGSVRQRLRLPEDATDKDVRTSVADQLTFLRRLSESPIAEPAVKRAAQTLRRTCEGLIASDQKGQKLSPGAANA
jgi:50S ribosome-binding GTPase